MSVYNVHQAKTHLSRLLEEAANGEEVVIAKAGKPMARVVPIVTVTEKRPLGLLAGRIKMAPDFDELPEEILRAFEGEDL